MRAVLALLLLSFVTGAAGQTDLSVTEFGAVGDRATDNTAALNNALAVGCRQRRAVHFPAGTYLTRPLNPVWGCDMHVYGAGRAVSVLQLQGTGNYNLMSFGGPGKTLQIHDLQLDGRQFDAAGLQVDDMYSAVIENAIFKNFGAPGYSYGHHSDYDGLYLRAVETATVRNVVSQYNERDGISAQAVHTLIIDGCNFSYNGRMGAVAEQRVDNESDGPRNVTITNNTILRTGSGGIDVETARALPPALAYVHGNTVEETGGNSWGYGWGIVLGVNAYGEISGNMVLAHGKAAGPVGYRSGVVVGRPGGDVRIIDNVITDSGEDGIRVSDGSGRSAYIANNVVARNGRHGINIYDAPASAIRNGNSVHDNAADGIIVVRSANTVVSDNYVWKNGGAPIAATTSPGSVAAPNTYGPPAPTSVAITTACLPDGVLGVSYSLTLVASNGAAPYTWSVLSGALAPGLNLSADGRLSGFPAAEGVYYFTLEVRDAAGNQATQAFSLTATTVRPRVIGDQRRRLHPN